MTKATNWKREGVHTVTPRLIFKDVSKALKFYEAAFGAKRGYIATMPGGDRVMHGEIQIGDSVLFIAGEAPEQGCISPETAGIPGASLYLSVENSDATFDSAVKAGATAKMAVSDMFWGDRWGVIQDPFGNTWEIATHKEDVTPQELEQRTKQACAQMASVK